MSSPQRERKHHYYIMWFWKRSQSAGGAEHWLGCLEHPNGEKTYFKSLEELVEMLKNDGWHQPFGSIKEG